MSWQLVSKEEAADFCGVSESFLKDSWSKYIEGLIFSEYKHSVGVSTYTERYSGDGKDILFLRHTPVLSVQSIRFNDYGANSMNYVGLFGDIYANTSNYVQLGNGAAFPKGIQNIEVTYTAGVLEEELDSRLALAELTCLAYLVKFMIANRGEDSVKFSSASSMGTNQYTSRPGVIHKMREIVKSLVPQRVRMR